MLYTVKYKSPGACFWRKVKRVKGDGIMPENGNRYLILNDDSRLEIPKRALIHFSRGRYEMIKQQMEKEAGQPLKMTQ